MLQRLVVPPFSGELGVERTVRWGPGINPLNAEYNPTCHLLALLEAHHILHVAG